MAEGLEDAGGSEYEQFKRRYAMVTHHLKETVRCLCTNEIGLGAQMKAIACKLRW